MSELESDTEIINLSSPNKLNNGIQWDSPTFEKKQYEARRIENLLKMSSDPKEYIITKNSSPCIRSDVWNIFGFPTKVQSDGTHEIITGFVACFDCSKTLLYNGSTKYMIRHKCLFNFAARAEQVRCQRAMDEYLSQKPIIQKRDKKKLTEKFIIWSCSSIRPFSIVEDPGFLDILNEAIRIGQKYSDPINAEELIVSAKTVGNNVAVLADQYRSLLIPILKKQADDGCLCIAPDLWTDKHRKIAYIGITCMFVSIQFKLETIDLCCSEYDEYDNTGASLYLAIRKQLKLFGLEYYFDNKKLLFISDRGSNIKKALEGQDILFCFGHRLDNILEKTFSQIKPKKEKQLQATTTTVSRKRRAKAHASSDEDDSSDDDDDVYQEPSPSKQPEATTSLSSLPSKAKEILDMISASKSIMKYVTLTNINCEIKQNHDVALQQSNITRWISLSSLLRSIEASLEHVLSFILTKTAVEKQKINLNRINVEGLRDMVTLLKIFQDVITLIQHGDRPTLHMVYVGLNKLKLHLSGVDVDSNGEQIIIDDRHAGTEFFRKRLKQLLFMFQLDKKHLAGALLHPLYRKLTFVNGYQRSETHIFVRQLLAELYGYGLTQQSNNAISTTSEPLKKKHRSIEDQFIDPDDDEGSDSTLISTHQTMDELDKYLKMSIPEQFKVSNPLVFWQYHEDKLPYLAKLSRRLYSIPATSTSVERQFSADGILINERRSSLNPDTVENVLFIRSIQKALKNNPDLFSV